MSTHYSTAMLALTGYGSCLTLLVLALHDLRRRRLPNRLVAVVSALYLVSALTAPATVWPHLAVAAAALLVAMLLTARGVMGGGDAKLIGAVLCWAGPQLAWFTLVITTQAGLILALAGLSARWLLRRQTSRRLRPALRCLTTDRGVPYGVALALGGICAIVMQINVGSLL